MPGGSACTKTEQSTCHLFEIKNAELDDPSCEIGTTERAIEITIKGKGHGTPYTCRLDIYHVKGKRKPHTCELRWHGTTMWKPNHIGKSITLTSNSDYSFRAWIRRLASVTATKITLALTVTLDHQGRELRQHKVDLRVTVV